MATTIRDRLKRRMLVMLWGAMAIGLTWYLAMTFVVHPAGWTGNRHALSARESLLLAG